MAQGKELLQNLLMELEDKEMKMLKWHLKESVLDGYPPLAKSRLEGADREDTVDLLVQTYSLEGALVITPHILGMMNRNDLVEKLQTVGVDTTSDMKASELKASDQDGPSDEDITLYVSNVKVKFVGIYEGLLIEKKTPLNQVYTKLYIMPGGREEVNTEHEVRRIEAASWSPEDGETAIQCEDILKDPSGGNMQIKTTMTKGIAGIGKTFLVHKFTLSWAEGKANQDIHLIFPLQFRELNRLKGKPLCLVDLICNVTDGIKMEVLYHIFTELQNSKNLNVSTGKYRVLFILDGLDECRLRLDFTADAETCAGVTETSTVDVLLASLIRGKLLPSARLWITTRPAAARQIPRDLVDAVTEVRGFTDAQKEEYFGKRFGGDEKLADRVISHVKASRSLHIMCHIPVFCWITATVLEHMLRARKKRGKMPKTLTEMYTQFLVFQCIQGNVKYRGRAETDPQWNPESSPIILSLGRLAFEQLEKGHLVFYEADLRECDIDVETASVDSGVLTQIFRECGLKRDKLFSFVHLSVQEFLAALYVFLSFVNSGVNLLSEPQPISVDQPEQSTSDTVDRPKQSSSTQRHKKSKPLLRVFGLVANRLKRKQGKGNPERPELSVYHSAVDKALQSENGHLDLFLRFLLGLSLKTNQTLLQELLTQRGGGSKTNRETAEYVKKKIKENPSPEGNINLFHCLNELNDHSLVEEIQQYLSAGGLSTKQLSPAQWSALVFVLLTSEEELDVFDLKKYSSSEEALLRLLPVVKASKTSL